VSATRVARPWLMVVSDRRRPCVAAGRPIDAAADLLTAQAGAAAAAGVAAFQIREPDLSAADLFSLVERIAKAASGPLRVVVNERADVAAAAAVGVHLKETAMATSRLRAWLPARLWISRAAHGLSALRDAGDVGLLVAGTVRATTSKRAGHRVLGFEGLAALARESAVPVIGIGGLSGGLWPALRQSGAIGFAGIGAFLPGPGESVEAAVYRAVADVGASVDSTGGAP